MVRKAIRRVRPKMRKRKPPLKRGNGTCSCSEALFSTKDWGEPKVETKKIGGKTRLTITVMCRLTIKCDASEDSDSKCVATLEVGVGNADFSAGDGNERLTEEAGSRRVDPDTPKRLEAACSGNAVEMSVKVTYTSEFDTKATKSVNGFVALNFVLACGTTKKRRAMRLVVKNSKLDVDESDYDGDGKKNREERDDRWDPDK